jgi:hypothetical protein
VLAVFDHHPLYASGPVLVHPRSAPATSRWRASVPTAARPRPAGAATASCTGGDLADPGLPTWTGRTPRTSPPCPLARGGSAVGGPGTDEVTEFRLSALVYGDVVECVRAVGRRGHG